MDYESRYKREYKKLKSAFSENPHLHHGKGSIEIYKSLSHYFAHLIHTKPFLNKCGKRILYFGPLTQSAKKFLLGLETHLYQTGPLTGTDMSLNANEVKAVLLFADHYLTGETYHLDKHIQDLRDQNIPTLLVSFQKEVSETIFPTSYLSLATVVNEDFIIVQNHSTNTNFPQSSDLMYWHYEEVLSAINKFFAPTDPSMENAIRVFENNLPSAYLKYFKDDNSRYLDRAVVYSPHIDGGFMMDLLAKAFPKLEMEKHCTHFSLSDTGNTHNRAQIQGLEQRQLRGLLCLSGQLILESKFQGIFTELTQMALERQGMNHEGLACTLGAH